MRERDWLNNTVRAEARTLTESRSRFDTLGASHHRSRFDIVGAKGVAAAALLCIAMPAARAQPITEYPVRPVRVIVGQAPGGGNDIQARLFAQKLTESLGRAFVVEN